MRSQPLPASFHAANRARLAETIGPDAIAIIDTADTLTRAGDFEYPFRPDSNFYYLTGISEPEAVLVLVPGNANAETRELLFISGTSEFVGAWIGERHTEDEATQLSGIKAVMTVEDMPRLLDRLLRKYRTVYLNVDESLESIMPSPGKRRAARMRESAPLHDYRSVIPLLAKQRMVKDAVEVDQIRRAIDLTAAGLQAAWAVMKPGAHEYELEADLTAAYLRGGAEGHSFMPIIASGAGTTIIHYMHNDAQIGSDDLVLFDTGAEVGWYAADISRTVPASGHFTDRQRALYEVVWGAQQAGRAAHKPGATIWSIDEIMREHLTEGLKQLELKGPLREYYAHISHHLGLDVHDGDDFRTPFEPGMVVTCEPGLYLRGEGIGVRLEDDLLITEDGHEVLSAGIPIEPDAIEEALR
jgi:Xaa-Pro aminopeptidase